MYSFSSFFHSKCIRIIKFKLVPQNQVQKNVLTGKKGSSLFAFEHNSLPKLFRMNNLQRHMLRKFSQMPGVK